MPSNKTSASQSKIDLATWGGLFLAGGGIVGGLLLEGGVLEDIAQYTAGVIVLGGTIGAVMVNTPMHVLKGALRRLGSVFFAPAIGNDALVEELITLATKARKTGLVSLEEDAFSVGDPFLSKALTMAIDGCDLSELRSTMEMEITLEEHHAEAEAKVFEAAGGFAPTIGIIGAVLGLIQVMKHLENIEEVGHGIAVAFVATVYGVALANLFCLPAAAKIKARIAAETERKEMMVEGVAAIVEGLNPKLIRSKLDAYLMHGPGTGKGKRGNAGPKAMAA